METRTRKAQRGGDLAPGAANFVPLSPISFLSRSADVYPDKTAVIHGDIRYTYAQFAERCRRLASALRRRGVRRGDTVAIIAPNVPAMLEAHYGIPMAGAVLNAINTRLDARSIAACLAHGRARLLIADSEYFETVEAALRLLRKKPPVVEIVNALHEGRRIGQTDYEALLAEGDPGEPPSPIRDEWQSISLLYTSGTTGNPKGVVYHHRGAYLNAMGNALAFGLSPATIYLWSLPMFHCNGWTYTWAVTAVGGTHVCLRRVEAAAVFEAIGKHRVTHMCGAPVVLSMLIHAPQDIKRRFDRVVEIATGGAAPPSAVISGMEAVGFRVTHLYGLTESFGPATSCVLQDGWENLPPSEKAAKMARQGVRYATLEDVIVANPTTLTEVPRDGIKVGEILLRGNTVMKGYLRDSEATREALQGGWFHTGDLAVRHPDGYIEIKDRAKDIIISGGENISSLEIEEALYKHEDVMEAAVVARPDAKWGESPCAFVCLRPGAAAVSAEDIIAWCRQNLAHFKVPKTIVFGPLPKTSTGKIQKYLLRERARQLDVG